MKQNQEDKIISGFLKSLGSCRAQAQNLPVGTCDIDSLIPRKVPEISKMNIAKYLAKKN